MPQSPQQFTLRALLVMVAVVLALMIVAVDAARRAERLEPPFNAEGMTGEMYVGWGEYQWYLLEGAVLACGMVALMFWLLLVLVGIPWLGRCKH